ncbi:hypothetical protein SALBM135S_09240 [Streptomyces alboniger]
MAIRHQSIASKAAKAAKAARVAKAKRIATEGKIAVEPTPLSKSFSDPRDVLVKPVVSEKSYALLDEGKYTFIVAPGSNKTQIKQAVEAVFVGQGHRSQHDQPSGQAQAHQFWFRQACRHQARECDPC